MPSLMLLHEQLLTSYTPIDFNKAHDSCAVDGLCWAGKPATCATCANKYWGDALGLTGVGHVAAVGRLRMRIVIALAMFPNRPSSCPEGL
jgi:hypothetical protein